MFGVGLHFSISDLMEVRRFAIPGTLAQITVATALGVVVGRAAGWGFGPAVVVVAKSGAALGLVTLLGGTVRTGVFVGAGLAQVGEFSFIFATTAVRVGLSAMKASS
jgi:predicted Kef-type K+ transport protein